MNFTKFFRKNSKAIIIFTVGAFAFSIVISLIGSYIALFFDIK